MTNGEYRKESRDVARELGAIVSRLTSIDQTLTLMRKEQSALWKKIDQHTVQITRIKTQATTISAAIALGVTMVATIIRLLWS